MKRLLFLALVGCGPNYDRTEISQQSTPGAITTSRIVVPAGLIETARIESFNSSDETVGCDISSDNENVLLVRVSTTDHVYTFHGNSVGSAVVSFKVDGNLVLRVDAKVVAQPLP